MGKVTKKTPTKSYKQRRSSLGVSKKVKRRHVLKDSSVRGIKKTLKKSPRKIRKEKLTKTVLRLLGDDKVEMINGMEQELQQFQDLDLLELGLPPTEYDNYTKLLRKEYYQMDDGQYRNTRLKRSKGNVNVSRLEEVRVSAKRQNQPSTSKSVRTPPKSKLSTRLRTAKQKQITNSPKSNVTTRSRSKKLQAARKSLIDSKDSSGASVSMDKILNNVDKMLTNILGSIEETSNSTDRENTLIFIPNKDEVIVLDDDDDDEDKPRANAETSLAAFGKFIHEQSTPKNLFFEDKTSSTRKNCKIPTYSKRSTAVFEESDCVMLDDFTADVPKPKDEVVDDSIIFVSEEKLPANNGNFGSNIAPDFIALPKISQEELTNMIRPKRHVAVKNIPGSVLKQSNSKYNYNIYNPDLNNSLKPGKRLIVVDGNNVAFAHGLNNEFSSEGIAICVEYFLKMGHEIKVVIPQFRMHKSSNPSIMEHFQKRNIIVVTPCKALLHERNTASYDDRFILQLASTLDGVVISNDNYRDIMTECPEFMFVIKNRVVGYTWCTNVFILPKDPYGRNGPKLEDILIRK